MDAMFFEHGCRDERQVVNGLAAGAMLRAPMDTKQIQVMAPEIYSGPIGRTGFRELYIFCVSGPLGYESRVGSSGAPYKSKTYIII
jgi:hypothetical protein